jgi:hypothetical protein
MGLKVRISVFSKMTPTVLIYGKDLLKLNLIIVHRITVFFWTFPSSGFLETRKHDVSETGSVSVLR